MGTAHRRPMHAQVGSSDEGEDSLASEELLIDDDGVVADSGDDISIGSEDAPAEAPMAVARPEAARGSAGSSGDASQAVPCAAASQRSAVDRHRADSGAPKEPAFVLEHPLGTVRFYSSVQSFVAECTSPGHGRCRLTRTCRPSPIASKAAQGRPIGLLSAWLAQGSQFQNADEHKHAFVVASISFEDRAAARQEASAFPAYHTLTGFERPRRDEEGDEPAGIA